MIKDFFQKAGWNLILRGLTIGGKFLLAVFIAKYLSLEALGVYGIITISVLLSTYLLSMDFYNYSSRIILQNNEEQRGAMLLQQFIFYGLTYIIFLPLLGFIFFYGVIEMKYIAIFYALLIVEHISIEMYRLLVMFSKPVIANINIFLRSGIWAYLLLLLWISGSERFKNVDTILFFWLVSSIASVVISLFIIAKEKVLFSIKHKINWKWIVTGIKISMPFLLATISYKAIEFADRYMIDYWMTTSDVGIYTFFSGIGNLVESFVQASVVMIFIPKLLESFNVNKDVFKVNHAQFKKQIIQHTIIVSVICVAFCYPLLIYLDKEELQKNFEVLILLILSKVVFNLSLIYHYFLYSMQKDNAIIYSTLLGAVINIILNIILIPLYGLIGAASATLISLSTVTAIKYYYYQLHIRYL